MNLSAFSPALVLVFVFALLWILMGIRYRELTPTQKWLVPLALAVLSVFNHLLRDSIGAALYSKTIFLTLHLPTFLIFWWLTRCSACKMFFMILSALVFTAPTVIIGNIAKQFMAFDPVLTQLAANLVGYIVMLLLAQFVFRKGFNYMLKYGDNRLFLLMSTIPLLYYFYVLAVANMDFSSMANTPLGYFVRHVPTLEVFVFYFVLMQNYKDLSERRELESAQTILNQQLGAAQDQITLLNTAQTRMAVYQHDMRHHLNALEALISSGNSDQAEDYIKHIRSDVEAITPHRFCENELVNLLCSSFCNKAEAKNIRLQISAKLPDGLSISDTELCSILSNGLENALRAAESLPDERKWVELYCGLRLNKLLLEIKNPYNGEIQLQNDLPVSGQPGHGYGCRSIRTITERYHGHCSFEPENGIFTLRVMLPAGR